MSSECEGSDDDDASVVSLSYCNEAAAAVHHVPTTLLVKGLDVQGANRLPNFASTCIERDGGLERSAGPQGLRQSR